MLPKQLKDSQRHQRQPKQVELFLQSCWLNIQHWDLLYSSSALHVHGTMGQWPEKSTKHSKLANLPSTTMAKFKPKDDTASNTSKKSLASLVRSKVTQYFPFKCKAKRGLSPNQRRSKECTHHQNMTLHQTLVSSTLALIMTSNLWKASQQQRRL